jgi:uncharacterized RDD family membrane protein YckC
MENPSSPNVREVQPAGLFRRFAALLYDGLLLFASLFFATLPILAFTGGQAIAPKNLLFSAYLLSVAFLFFAWFWTHGGQTLGMRAWRVRVQCPNGSPISLAQAAVRFTVAIVSWVALGVGFWWSWLDRERRTWHDIVSATVLVLVAKKSKAKGEAAGGTRAAAVKSQGIARRGR